MRYIYIPAILITHFQLIDEKAGSHSYAYDNVQLSVNAMSEVFALS